MEFSAAADELYGAEPADFTATRTRLADELSKDDARQLKALRKPTVPAWAVNLLVRDDAVGPLLLLGEQFRKAWESGDDIGALERERVTLVESLLRRTRTLAADAGRPLNDSYAREVEDTLQAAIADPGAAQAVREGRLVRPLSHAGFGLLGVGPAAPPTAPKPRKSQQNQVAGASTATKADAARQAEEERARRVAEAERTLADREAALDELQRELTDADERVKTLREQLMTADNERDRLDRRVQTAIRERDRAARQRDRAARVKPA